MLFLVLLKGDIRESGCGTLLIGVGNEPVEK